MVPADFDRARHPCVERVVGGFEGEHQERGFVRPRHAGERLARFEEAEVRRVEAGLGDLAHCVGAGEEVPEAHAGGGAERRLLAEPHPGLGDDAEDAFGAEEHSVGARPGAGAGQAAGFERADRGDDPHAFDEIVDVGVERRVVTARPCRDPAAQRRAAIRLHVVAHGEGRVAELVLDVRPVDAALDPRRLADGIDLEHLVHVAERDRHHLVECGGGLDTLHHRRSAAIGDRRSRRSRSHQSRMRTMSASLSGKATASGGLGTERMNMRQASNQAFP